VTAPRAALAAHDAVTHTLTVRVLGLMVFRSATGWRPGPPKYRGGRLLQMLVTRPHQVVTVNSVADAYPADLSRENLVHRLHIAASGARAFLRRLVEFDVIRTVGAGYALCEDVTIGSDLGDFVRLYREGTVDAFALAVRQYGGELLAGEDDGWVQPIRGRVTAMYVEMLERLAVDAYETGRISAALDHGVALTSIDRSHEGAARLVMRCHAAMGRRMAVIDEYDSLKRFLLEHLGAEPSPETLNLYYTLTA